MSESLPFDSVGHGERAASEPMLIVDVDGYEGPLDLLLDLARRQKVDLARISILALVEQYLAFIEEARKARLELAADYLVMAAWLAFLKSRLLLPEPPKGDEPSADELASVLAFRLRRLEAIRAAAKLLADRDRLGRDIFVRGAPEPLADVRLPLYQASLYDLLAAYAQQRQKQANAKVTLRRRMVWSLLDAREALERLIGMASDWTALDPYLLHYAVEAEQRITVRASSFSAMLELVKEGHVELRQDAIFSPLWVRRRAEADPRRQEATARAARPQTGRQLLAQERPDNPFSAGQPVASGGRGPAPKPRSKPASGGAAGSSDAIPASKPARRSRAG